MASIGAVGRVSLNHPAGDVCGCTFWACARVASSTLVRARACQPHLECRCYPAATLRNALAWSPPARPTSSPTCPCSSEGSERAATGFNERERAIDPALANSDPNSSPRLLVASASPTLHVSLSGRPGLTFCDAVHCLDSAAQSPPLPLFESDGPVSSPTVSYGRKGSPGFVCNG